MNWVLRNKEYNPLLAEDIESQRRYEADAEERRSILLRLEDALESEEDVETIDWEFQSRIDLLAASSLSEVHRPGQSLWNTLAMRSHVTETLRWRAPDEFTRISSAGVLEVFEQSNEWNELDLGVHEVTGIPARLKLIGDIAGQAGGYVYWEGKVYVDQWLKFHDFDVPETIGEVRNLIDFFKFDFPKVDHLDNYWGQLVTDDPALVVLSDEQRLAIKSVTAQLIAPNEKLLDVLFRKTRSAIALHDNAAERIEQLISHPTSQDYAYKYIELLGWFGTEAGQEVSAQQLGRLLITAILLDLNPFIGRNQGRKCVGSFELYSPSYIGRPSAIVLEGLRDHIVANRWATHDTAPMAIHLLLADIAPEFLVRQVPTALYIGSIEWMSFCRGVALVEAVTKGASRVMTYSQIMAYAKLAPVSQALTDLHTLAMIDPIIDWALINEVVTQEELRQTEQGTTQRAIAAYEQYAANFSQITRAYSTPLPDRKAIARAALERAAPTCDFLEKAILHQKPGLYASPTVMSMVDLHMSGDLMNREWDFRAVFPDSNSPDLLSGITNQKKPSYYDPSVVSLYTRYPGLLRLPSNNSEFHGQLRGYRDELKKALATTLKLALSRLSVYELRDILQGEITFFTIRDSAVIIRKTPIGGPLVREEPVESQEGKDAATGRFGIVMCVSHGGRMTCYEIFTLRGEIYKNDELGTLIVRTGKFQAAARLDFSGDLKAHELPTPTERLPVNIKCYIDGVANDFKITSSTGIIDKLGVLPAPATPSSPKKNDYQNFSDPQLVRIAQFIVSRHPLMTFDQLESAATKPTALELEREKGEKIATYIVDLVVPFKKCVEDLSTGEHNQVVDGIYGCAMDAIALVGAFAGAGAKAASIVAKAASMSSRLASLAKLAIGTGISIFNPLDDVPSLLKGTGKLVYKGGLRLSRQAQEIVAVAKSQLAHIKGAHNPQNLIGQTHGVKAGQGTWRPHSASADTLTVVAARKDFQWYALDRTGKPWGPKLSNFSFQTPVRIPQFSKTLPVSYTRHFIEKSLPQAKAKIENAVNALSSRDFTKERDAVIKMFLGSNTTDASDRFLKYLKLIRTDFAGLSLSNFILDPFKDNGNIAAFNTDIYKQWKALNAVDQADVSFIEIYTRNLSKHFIQHGYNHDVVADDLIHEMLHGAAQTDDVSYAVDAAGEGATAQVLDVASLLNLARGQLSVAPDASTMQYHAASKAFENADSLAVATSLLSQLYTDKPSFDRNLSSLETAAAASRNGKIAEPVLVTLNKP
ncbi:MAG TPA: hypothetical protein VJ889_27400 [Pseudomonas sp.]|nr:hypothetical protein [Pseudomonas sp.]